MIKYLLKLTKITKSAISASGIFKSNARCFCFPVLDTKSGDEDLNPDPHTPEPDPFELVRIRSKMLFFTFSDWQ